MRLPSGPRSTWATLLLLASTLIGVNGCARAKHRLQADHEAYATIAERNFDPRWHAHDYSIEIDPRSRYFDAYDPDHSPMPPDDPTSHQYMHLVDGIKGWKHWHKNGERIELENPAWREALVEYVDISENGAIKLDVDSAIRLAYVHSPNHQRQLETLYLSALDVSAERFLLDTQFFGGYAANYAHLGSLTAPGFMIDPNTRSIVISPAAPRNEQNRLTVGRGLPLGSPAVSASRRFATAGELLVGFANSFVFEFTNGDLNLATSLANFMFMQPLLRGAGKDIALENLTIEERQLLANVRAYGQFRQGFYTQVAIGELGVTGPQRSESSTALQSFSGSGQISGFLGLLQQRQRIRNSEDNLSLQEKTLARLQALYENDLTTLVQVYQFRQSVQDQRSDLLISRNALELQLDRYKTGTLGLPPDVAIELDESLIRPFQLVPREATTLQTSILQLQRRVGEVAELLDLNSRTADLQTRLELLPDNAEVEAIRRFLVDLHRVAELVELRIDNLPADLAQIQDSLANPDPASGAAGQELIQLVRDQLREGPAKLAESFADANVKLQTLQDELTEETKDAIVSSNIEWLRDLLRQSQGCLLVQSRAGNLPGEPNQVLTELDELVAPARQLLNTVQDDLARMNAIVPKREQTMTEKEKEAFRLERKRLGKLFEDLAHGPRGFKKLTERLESLRGGLGEQNRRATARGLVSWVQELVQVVERLVLVPAQARLEVIVVDPINITPEDAFPVALSNRLDFMNGRAALVDRWRSIQVDADALQSVVNVTASGNIRTARNNAVSFKAPTGTLRMGLEFDAPITRLLQRNTYRETLINYQQNRRTFIQSRDSLQLGLRALIRNIEQLRQNLEIQRRAVTIAMRRVDQTQLDLNPPRQPVQPGQRAPINQTLAIQLLGAQTALRDSQNAFLAVWLNYYAARMRLHRELGIMTLDPEGRWIEYPLGGPGENAPDNLEPDRELVPLPPAIPAGWIEVVNFVQPLENGHQVQLVAPAGHSTAAQPLPPPQVNRLPPTSSTSDTNGFNSP